MGSEMCIRDSCSAAAPCAACGSAAHRPGCARLATQGFRRRPSGRGCTRSCLRSRERSRGGRTPVPHEQRSARWTNADHQVILPLVPGVSNEGKDRRDQLGCQRWSCGLPSRRSPAAGSTCRWRRPRRAGTTRPVESCRRRHCRPSGPARGMWYRSCAAAPRTSRRRSPALARRGCRPSAA